LARPDRKTSAAFQLAVSACRSGFCGAGEAVERPCSAADWEDFARLAEFHRISGLCWGYVSSLQANVPASVADALRDAATVAATRNLQTVAECHDLRTNFEREGIPLLFLKGLTLGTLAYRNPALKSAIDIDLLIDPDDLLRAADLLRDSGYHLVVPTSCSTAEALRAWHRPHKESVWVKGQPRLQVDLHTRPADNPALIPYIDVHSAAQQVKVGGGVELPTLAFEDLFSYLAVHGASSAWFRLKWISDFAGLLHGQDQADIDRLYRRSQEMGAGRAAGQSLLLADSLFGSMGENDSLRQELLKDRAIRWLFRASLRRLTGSPDEPTEHRFGTLTIHAAQFLLKPGIRYKASEFAGQMSRLVRR